jgi:hypothetical protein
MAPSRLECRIITLYNTVYYVDDFEQPWTVDHSRVPIVIAHRHRIAFKDFVGYRL